jgi:hypothetical protein
VSLPWSLVERLPLIGNGGVPSRIAVFVFLCVGLLMAVFLDAALVAREPRWMIPAAALVALSVLALTPRLPFLVSTEPVPAFFQPGGDVSHIRPGTVALIAPFADAHSAKAMYWQAASDFRFRMPEGDAFTPGPYLGPSPSYLGRVLTGLDQGGRQPDVTPEERRVAMAELRERQVRAVVVGPCPGRDQIVTFFTGLLGRPPQQSGGVDVWWGVDAATAASG